jgi:hypothetical protein
VQPWKCATGFAAAGVAIGAACIALGG